jgi:hypothetical protein
MGDMQVRPASCSVALAETLPDVRQFGLSAAAHYDGGSLGVKAARGCGAEPVSGAVPMTTLLSNREVITV